MIQSPSPFKRVILQIQAAGGIVAARARTISTANQTLRGSFAEKSCHKGWAWWTWIMSED
ncbi:hypothetical protein P170DRAFT_438486 [Aspergillus steynii IBT 23096]|uniref:Uncharacterized protein n=1 Tax=Aspergillus steynii IBT 23096 TaxID=1392250 RepID=A0A2I2G1M9_9EURO|nr:uncharacterized protein P170DRAFT_438486 [Aspergillus steynii IBT 23096]PLB46782.1 hypothetical protein P170DRAFT_438486 [Aspergillus steynii IBT 23096]